MKHMLIIAAALLAFLSASATIPAEELEEFLKRTGMGNATKSDVHENFHGIVFVGDQAIEVDRDKLLQVQEQQKGMGAKPILDGWTILSKTETSIGDGKGIIISVVSKAAVTVKVGNSTVNGQTVSHDVILCYPDGKLRIIFTAARQ